MQDKSPFHQRMQTGLRIVRHGMFYVATALYTAQQGQRGALMPWLPVALALGVAFYFNLQSEPSVLIYIVASMIFCAGFALFFIWRDLFGPVGIAFAMVAAGVLIAGVRAHHVAGPILDWRYFGMIEGRVVILDRSASDVPRLTLDRVRLERISAQETPRRVRVSLHGEDLGDLPLPGSTVRIRGHLWPPSGPVEPGGFDFQRHSWFLSLGAVGYSRDPVVSLAPRTGGEVWLFNLRVRLSHVIQGAIPGQPGAFAAAVLTGDRSALTLDTVQAMRDANIAHLLAISGLHMGLLTGFVFAAVRTGLALVPTLALRYPIRKWAAGVALIVGAFYLALSGGNVATERAFTQVAVMFAAVLMDRRAVTLRSVAIAALIVLLRRPETLMSPGFQMSFAATTALVGVFAGVRDAQWLVSVPRPVKAFLALVMSSVVAGAATAPFAAAHFNRIAAYGLAANLLSVPLMGSVVIPAAVAAAVVWPLGLSPFIFVVMEWGLQWMLAVAHYIAAVPGAIVPVVAPPHAVLGLIALGGLFILLWQGRGRWLGVVPILAAFVMWGHAERPTLLISEGGRLAGLWQADARGLSRARGDGFVARIWLENDGDAANQEQAAARPIWRADGRGASANIGPFAIWHGSGRRALAEALGACARHDLIILSERAEAAALRVGVTATRAMLQSGVWAARPVQTGEAAGQDAPQCFVIDSTILRRTGALAMTLSPTGAEFAITTAREQQGNRLWSVAR